MDDLNTIIDVHGGITFHQPVKSLTNDRWWFHFDRNKYINHYLLGFDTTHYGDNLENWSKDKKYDRLGSADEVVQLGEVDIPQIKIPVKTGRNVAIIIEVAAMNFRAKTMGYDATLEFENRLTRLIEENSAN